MKTLAVIVLYNPDIERLNQNIEAIFPQVDGIVLVDNGSNNLDEVRNNVTCEVQYVTNEKNMGIAKALNEGFEFAIEHDYDWVLTLDQDSVSDKNLIEIYKKYMYLPDIGMLTCNFIDRHSKIPLEDEKNEEYYTVSRCITSASFCSVEAYKKSGGFDDEMFIDFVDYDYSIKMYLSGYKIYRINYDGLLHELGRSKTHNILGLKFVTVDHSAFRHYYLARNSIIMSKKYPKYYKKSAIIVDEIRKIAVILLFEKQKWQKIRRRFSGVKDGIRYKVSK